MRGYTEANYAVKILDDNGETCFRVAKESIVDNINKNQRSYAPTKSKFVYNVFMERYPFLKEIDRKKIEIVFCWSTFHPLSGSKCPSNKMHPVQVEQSKQWNEVKKRLYLEHLSEIKEDKTLSIN